MRRAFDSQPALFATPALLDHPALQALDEVEALIDWSRLAPLLPQGRGRTGRPGWPAMTLFRALLLGLWHELSDVKLEGQLARDLVFRRFCRLELDQAPPDASALGRFRMELEREGRLQTLLDEINAGLAEAGVVLEEGRVAIVDATVVEAARSRRATADPEAGSRVKLDGQGRRKGVWGWQAFVNADEDGFIHATAITPGNRHEITALHRLMRGGERQLYADAAYSAGWVRRALARAGVDDRVQRKGYRNRPLGAADRARNREIAVTRGRVEAIFGALKRSWGLARTRFLGEARNAAQLALTAIAWNLRKGATLRRSGA